MSVTIHAASSPGEVRVAAERNGMLLDYALWRPGAPDGVGDLHRGRISAVAPGMAGAFVALEGADGFLPDSEGAKGLTEGTILAVRVTRAAQGGKGPRLTARIAAEDQALAGSGPARLVCRGPDAVSRLAAQYPDAPVRVDDPALMARLRPALGDRVALARPAFDDAIATAIEALSETAMDLPGGARLSIHPTPALVAIDVDSGGAMQERRSKAEQHARLNRAVLPAIARQIRLRNLSGAIVLDLAGLPIRRRAALGPALEAALAEDPLRPRFLGFTALGLAEILRPRVHPPLHELLAGPHAAGLAALRAITANLEADPRRLPALRASPAVVTALRHDTVALAALVRLAGRPLTLRSDPSLADAGWILESEHG